MIRGTILANIICLLISKEELVMGIQIGDGNKFTNSNVAEKIDGKIINSNVVEKTEPRQTEEKKRFYDKHPWISGFIILGIVAFVFLFTFWTDIIHWIEGWF